MSCYFSSPCMFSLCVRLKSRFHSSLDAYFIPFHQNADKDRVYKEVWHRVAFLLLLICYPPSCTILNLCLWHLAPGIKAHSSWPLTHGMNEIPHILSGIFISQQGKHLSVGSQQQNNKPECVCVGFLEAHPISDITWLVMSFLSSEYLWIREQ